MFTFKDDKGIAASSSLTSLDVSNWDTSNVTNMRSMFYYCSSLTSLDVSKWDTSNVTDMGYMFWCCSSLTSLDVSNWDTSNVTDMYFMFFGCPLTSLDVSKWDTSNAINMGGMFDYCQSLTSLDLSNWDTSNVTDMSDMFKDCSLLKNILGTINMTSIPAIKSTSNDDGTVTKTSNFDSMFENTNALASVNIKLPSIISKSDFLKFSKVTNTSAVHFVS